MSTNRSLSVLGAAVLAMGFMAQCRPAKGEIPSPRKEGCEATIQFLCDALRAADSDDSVESSLVPLLEGALTSSDRELREAGFRFLEEVTTTRNLDPRLLSKALARFDQLQTPSDCEKRECEFTDGREFAEESALRRAPRAERIAFMSRAIEQGEACFGEFYCEPRCRAIVIARHEGLWELRALVERYTADGSCLRSVERQVALTLFDLREGSSDLASGDGLAVKRLMAMDRGELFEKLVEEGVETQTNGEGPWHLVLSALTSDVIKNGSPVACADLRAILKDFSGERAARRQRQLEGFQLSPQTPRLPEEPEAEKLMGDWLASELAALVGCPAKR